MWTKFEDMAGQRVSATVEKSTTKQVFLRCLPLVPLVLLAACSDSTTVRSALDVEAIGATGDDSTNPEAVALQQLPGPDTDGDGLRNQEDLDDDNDGILDVDEGGIDADGDGFLDANSRDTDGDGTPDARDLDSDNDGISDLREALTDQGLIDALDLASVGAIDITFAIGTNGIPDLIETSPDSGVLIFPLLDTDGDGLRDAIDLDSDNDSIPDLVEAGGTDSDGDGRVDNFVDADGKGLADSLLAAGLTVFDTDSDGIADFRDLDSDNDGLPDQTEAGPNGSSPTDTDGDGAPDFRETDSDGDGVPDGAGGGNVGSGGPIIFGNPGSPGAGNLNPNPNGGIGGAGGPDTDGDGVRNQIDLDDDNDGILDVDEGAFDNDGDCLLYTSPSPRDRG